MTTSLGSQGADVFLGGDGNDFIDGQQGDDVALMGAGNDTFQWDPGDGSDAIEGQAGTDRLLFNGSNASENIDISANGRRVGFFRDVGNVTMDLNDVEQIDFNALGGADKIVVGDLSGTDVTEVNLNLAGALGGNAGDGQADTVTVNGTNGDDTVKITGSGDQCGRHRLASTREYHQRRRCQRSADRQRSGWRRHRRCLQPGGWCDRPDPQRRLGRDVLIGSKGNDLVNGGDGDDVAFMGAGDDTFVWNPGDDNDTVEGQDGTRQDALQRLERQREHRHLGQRRAGAASPATSPT